MVGIALIDLIHEMKICGSIYGKSRRWWKCAQDCAAHRLPHALYSSDDGRGGGSQLADFLAGNKGIGLADGVACARHSGTNFFRDIDAPDASKCADQSTGDN